MWDPPAIESSGYSPLIPRFSYQSRTFAISSSLSDVSSAIRMSRLASSLVCSSSTPYSSTSAPSSSLHAPVNHSFLSRSNPQRHARANCLSA